MATRNKPFVLARLGEEALAAARPAWLAGLGALSLAREGASELFTKAVERGRELEGRGREEGGKLGRRLTASAEDLGASLDRGVTAALSRLGIPTRTDVRELTRRVEELTKTVSRLAAPAAKARSSA